jgi:hypothetical protein
MNTSMNQTAVVSFQALHPEESHVNLAFGLRLLRVAWLAIVLGIFLEMVLLAVKIYAGSHQSAEFYAADLAQKVSWSLFVCVGVAAGQSIGRVLQPLAAGVVGFVVSPLAFAAAKGIHKAVSSSLQLAMPTAEQVAPSPWVIALLKGIEFALLGVLLAWLATKSWAGFRTHAASGLLTGIVFGSALVAYGYFASSPHPELVAIVAQALNELIYPVGCACVIYSTSELGKRFSSPPRA